MAQRGRWIFSIAGDVCPQDVADECTFASKTEAIEAALEFYWPVESRKSIREAHAKTGGYKLRFYVGLVVAAGLNAIPGREIVSMLIGEQSTTIDAPADWPDASPADIKTLELRVASVINEWLRSLGMTPSWDAVSYETVEVEA